MNKKKAAKLIDPRDRIAGIVRMLARHWVVLTVGAMIATFGLALWLSLGVSIWFDENYSIMVSQRPINELIALTAVDAHPPLYYLLLKAWAALFGWNELALRSLSALFGALGVGAMALLVRQLFTRNVAVTTLPFMIFAPFLLRYDYEIRMYALVAFVGILSTWVLVKAWQSHKIGWWIAYGLLVATGLYTLYMSAVIWLAHLVWLIILTRQSGKSIVRQRYWLSYGLAAILLLPWVPTVVHQLLDSALPPMEAVTLKQLVNVTGLLLGYVASWQIGAWLSLGIVAFGVLFIMLYVRVWKQASVQYKKGLLLLTLGFVVGMIFYVALSLPPMQPRFNERYVAHIAPYAYVLIGVLVALGWRIGHRRLATAFATISLVLLVGGVTTLHAVGNYNFQRAQPPKGKEVVARYGCDNTTFISNDLFEYVDMYYNFRACDLRFYAATNPAFTHGYAPLHDSPQRVTNTDQIVAKRIIVIVYDENVIHIIPDARYKLVASDALEKVSIKIYEQ